MSKFNSNNNIFALPPIPSRYVQGLEEGVGGALYVAGSTATRDFFQPLGATGYKLGLTSRRSVNERILDLRRKKYGSIIADETCRDVTIINHARGHEWFLAPIENGSDDPKIAAALATVPHGEISNGLISFRLPTGVDLASLDQRFQDLLKPRGLNEFLASPNGQERLKQVGLPPRSRLFTDYVLIGQTRRSLAVELYMIRPRREIGVLITALSEALRLETQRLRGIRREATK